MKTLFIGGDPRIADLITAGLRIRWPEAVLIIAETATMGLTLLERERPALLILKPDFTDMTLAMAVKEVRLFSSIPMLVLDENDNKLDAVMSLEFGADDYMRLPCDLIEITSKIGALLRRTRGTSSFMAQAAMVSGPLLLRPATAEAMMDNKLLKLTDTEFSLLYLLMKNHGMVVTHQSISREIWSDQVDCSGVIKTYVQRIRRKLGDSGKQPTWILSVKGLGYRFIGPSPTIPRVESREVQTFDHVAQETSQTEIASYR